MIGFSTRSRIKPGRASIRGMTNCVTNVDKAAGFFRPSNQIFVRTTSFGFSDVGHHGSACLNHPFSLEFVWSHTGRAVRPEPPSVAVVPRLPPSVQSPKPFFRNRLRWRRLRREQSLAPDRIRTCHRERWIPAASRRFPIE